ncbi:MAG: CDP-glucose 4,6-dehydratase [Candidatus Firestonebacteria bacterium]|nr:CDP-glucose 4,6-dehydratase [Candidatus Firestonebacteria bacterium]
MKILFNNIYKDKTVLITGHTGFKGSWLALWLNMLGAKVIGYSLNSITETNHFDLLNMDINSIIGDVRDPKKIKEVFSSYNPDVIFHLAAQSLVRRSYKNPIETFETNLMGTINIFEASRITESVKAIVNITSDKCYENKEWLWGYRENEPLGGNDPYSASKACAELITNSYRNSFFNLNEYGKSHNVLLASCRSGNVIGGGDWAEDRLIPDIMRSIHKKEKVVIRNPNSIRPWQHVLDPLFGYLKVGQKLLENKKEFAEAWNFGPTSNENVAVEDIVKMIKNSWDKFDYEIKQNNINLHEANFLKLDSSKAYTKLKCKNIWNIKKTSEKTVEWYKEFYENNKVITVNQLDSYVNEIEE